MPRSPGGITESWLRDRVEREERHRRMDLDLDWKTWARERLAPYWYGVIVVFLDVAVVATLVGALRGIGTGAYGIAFMVLVFAVYAGLEVYRRLWLSGEVAVTSELRTTAKVRKLRKSAGESPAAGDAERTPEEGSPASAGGRTEAESAVPETHE